MHMVNLDHSQPGDQWRQRSLVPEVEKATRPICFSYTTDPSPPSPRISKTKNQLIPQKPNTYYNLLPKARQLKATLASS